MTREVHDLTGIIQDASIPKLEEHDEQIADLQEAVGLKPRRQ
jgi:hypothetical protein